MELLPNLPNTETHEDNDSHFPPKFLVCKSKTKGHILKLWIDTASVCRLLPGVLDAPGCFVSQIIMSVLMISSSHHLHLIYEVCYLAVVNGHLGSSLMVLPLCTWTCCFYPSSKHLTVQVNWILYLHIPAVPQFWAYHLLYPFAVA